MSLDDLGLSDYDLVRAHQVVTCSSCRRQAEREPPVEFVVCHHCGRVLCAEKCAWLVGSDRMFGGIGRAGRSAWHCRDCLKRFHPLRGLMAIRR